MNVLNKNTENEAQQPPKKVNKFWCFFFCSFWFIRFQSKIQKNTKKSMDKNTFYNVCYYLFFCRLCVSESVIKREKGNQKKEKKKTLLLLLCHPKNKYIIQIYNAIVLRWICSLTVWNDADYCLEIFKSIFIYLDLNTTQWHLSTPPSSFASCDFSTMTKLNMNESNCMAIFRWMNGWMDRWSVHFFRAI